ncbi:MAG TPA: TetR/AcrR family transcriptional regulator [Gammaproteobacteria bacterium]
MRPQTDRHGSKPGASPRIARRRERMRGALLAAAGRQFGTCGVAGVSVEKVIEEADVSRATFYRFFSSKYNLLEALLDPVFKMAIDGLRAQAERAPLEALEGLIDVYWQLWLRHRDALLLIASIDAESFKHFAAQHAALNKVMSRILVRAETAELLRNGSAQYSLKVIAKTAIPLLQVYDGHATAEALFRDALKGLLIRAH